MPVLLKECEKHIKERLDHLKSYTSTPGNGVTRLPFSKEARETTEYLKGQMESVGMKAYIDLVGNVRGRIEGCEKNAPAIMLGSHYDTVKNGGQFDGIAGVVTAIEIADLLQKNNVKLKYPLEVAAFNDEEGMMFGSGCLGSKALMGEVDQDYIRRLTDENGKSIEQWMYDWKSDPQKISSLKLEKNSLKAFIEIHIEQGPVLNEEKCELGIVDCIVGLLRCMVTINGRADHAGTTPIPLRIDAMDIAGNVISKIRKFAEAENNGSVATCGFIRAYPNAMNVIAGNVEFTIDIRSKQDESISSIMNQIQDLLDNLTRAVGASYDVEVKLRTQPVNLSKQLIDFLEEGCKNNRYSYRIMTSGAAHDAMIFAEKVNTAMLFVPSLNGRSHCPEEWTDINYFAKAVKTVYETIVKMNQN